MCKSIDNHPEHCDACCAECEACPVFSLEDHTRGCSKGLSEPAERYTFGFLDPDDRFEAGDPSHMMTDDEIDAMLADEAEPARRREEDERLWKEPMYTPEEEAHMLFLEMER